MSYLCLRNLEGIPSDTIVDSITDGGNDCGVDLLVIDDTNGRTTAYVISTRWFTRESKIEQPFPASGVELLRKFFAYLHSDGEEWGAVFNERLRNRAADLKKRASQNQIAIELWFVSNARSPDASQLSAFYEEMKYHGVKVRQYHNPLVSEILKLNAPSKSKRILKVKSGTTSLINDGTLPGAIGLLPAACLCEMLESEVLPEYPDPTLFALNVRGFLGFASEINRDIVATASGPDKKQFWAFNNGLTMVARSWDTSNLSLSGRIEVSGLSILNGAQTCGALFEQWNAVSRDPDRLGDIHVHFKILITDDDDQINKLTLTTNTQNRIRPRDIKANDVLQKRLENELAAVGVVYLRRHDTLVDVSSKPTLSSTRAGQLVMSYTMREPHRAKSQPERLFEDLHDGVFRNVNIRRLVRAMNLMEQIEDKSAYLKKENSIRVREKSYDFVSYAHFHILAVVALLEEEEPDADDRSLVEAAIEIVREAWVSAGYPAYYEFFRSPKTIEIIQQRRSQLDFLDGITG